MDVDIANGIRAGQWGLGLVFGSFAGSLGYRIAARKSLFSPSRSYCPACEATLRWYDNIPLLSHVLLKGRCRYCGHTLGSLYFLPELTFFLAAGWLSSLFDSPGLWAIASGIIFVCTVVSLVEAYGAPIPLWAGPAAGLLAACLGGVSGSMGGVVFGLAAGGLVVGGRRLFFGGDRGGGAGATLLLVGTVGVGGAMLPPWGVACEALVLVCAAPVVRRAGAPLATLCGAACMLTFLVS